jgi:hypothetical protein
VSTRNKRTGLLCPTRRWLCAVTRKVLSTWLLSHFLSCRPLLGSQSLQRMIDSLRRPPSHQRQANGWRKQQPPCPHRGCVWPHAWGPALFYTFLAALDTSPQHLVPLDISVLLAWGPSVPLGMTLSVSSLISMWQFHGQTLKEQSHSSGNGPLILPP